MNGRSLSVLAPGRGFGSLAAVPLLVPMMGLLTVASLLMLFGSPVLYAVALPGVLLALVVLRDPRVGFFLTVGSIPLEAAGMVTRLALNTPITITKVLALLTLLAWAFHVVAGRRRLLWTREIKAFAWLMAFAALSLVDAR